MKRRFLLLLPVLLALAPVPALAEIATMPPAASESGALRAACDEMAAVVISPDRQEAQVDKLLASMLAGMTANDGSVGSLNAKYPGLKDTVGAAMRPVLLRHVFSVLPYYRSDIAALYASNLTLPEARRASAFYRSAAFLHFANAANKQINYKAVTGDALADKDISAASVRADIQQAGPKAAAEMSPAEKTELMSFFGSPVGQKLMSLNPQKLLIDTKWANYSTPESEHEIQMAVAVAIRDHVAKKDPAMAEMMYAAIAKETEKP